MAEVSAPLRQLMEKKVQWHWNANHQQSFETLKTLITHAPVLKYYNVKAPLVLSVDASSEGLGAVLLQNNQPVAYASKPLNESQQKYAQIEKELLAILYGCERFHQYVYGRTVTVETDHKPLESIVTKPLFRAPVRLQRMLLRLQKYDILVVYKAGKEMYIADTLSRATTTKNNNDSTPEEDELHVHIILPASEGRLKELQEATSKDVVFKVLKSTIQNGWPNERAQVPVEIRDYWSYRDELSCYDNLLFRGQQLLIPLSQRADILTKLHQPHLGIERSKQRARDVMFWPGMSKQIQEMVSKCSLCLEYRNNNCKEPMVPHEIPNRPWSKVGADLFELNQENYLILVDYYSNFFEVAKLNSTKTPSIIKNLKTNFARHGIPDVLISDNGPQFDNAEVKQFAKEWQFTHKTSSPHYPKSNGLTERTIQTVKKVLKKAKRDGTDPNLAILELRNTPRNKHLGSPVQRLFSRRTRSLLPVSENLLKPKVVEDVSASMEKEKRQQKKYHDQHSKNLPTLSQGAKVMMKKEPTSTWKPATVKDQVAPRSYHVTDENAKTYRRNRTHLMKCDQPPTIPSDDSLLATIPTDKKDDKTNQEKKRVGTTRYGRRINPNPRYT